MDRDHGPGRLRGPWAVIGLSIITLGICARYPQYATFAERKGYAGRWIGGGIGLLFAVLLGIVDEVLMPAEVGHLHRTEGRQAPVPGLTGFWILLPSAGWTVWVVRTRGRRHGCWESRGATRARPRRPPARSTPPRWS